MSAALFGPSPAATTILVAEDDGSIRALLRILLERAGYRVQEAVDGEAALASVDSEPPDLILLDIGMPKVNGIDVVRRLRSRAETRLLPVILLTGMGSVDDKVEGLDAGATDFVTKPYERAELLARVRSALKMKSALDRLEDAQAVLVALANAVEAKDPATSRHCGRLATMAIALAQSAGLDADATEAIGYGAALHDVGKIGVAEILLTKAGSLTPGERDELRRHSALGASIVEPLRLGRHVAPIVRGHHERWDGAGYPDGLIGSHIPVGARIVAIVDSFDAMTTDRPYRRAGTPDAAREELVRLRGAQFDPDLVDLFIDTAESPEGEPASDLERVPGLRAHAELAASA